MGGWRGRLKAPSRDCVLFTQALTCPGAMWVGVQLNFPRVLHMSDPTPPSSPKFPASFSSLSSNLWCSGCWTRPGTVPRGHIGPVKAYTRENEPRPSVPSTWDRIFQIQMGRGKTTTGHLSSHSDCSAVGRVILTWAWISTPVSHRSESHLGTDSRECSHTYPVNLWMHLDPAMEFLDKSTLAKAKYSTKPQILIPQPPYHTHSRWTPLQPKLPSDAFHIHVYETQPRFILFSFHATPISLLLWVL